MLAVVNGALHAQVVDRGLPAVRRGEHDLESGVQEFVVGGGDLLEPGAGLDTADAHVGVRGHGHEYALGLGHE